MVKFAVYGAILSSLCLTAAFCTGKDQSEGLSSSVRPVHKSQSAQFGVNSLCLQQLKHDNYKLDVGLVISPPLAKYYGRQRAVLGNLEFERRFGIRLTPLAGTFELNDFSKAKLLNGEVVSLPTSPDNINKIHLTVAVSHTAKQQTKVVYNDDFFVNAGEKYELDWLRDTRTLAVHGQ